MPNPIIQNTFAILICILAAAPASAQDSPKPLQRAHAHNDYLHERPLLDALDHGFCSIEADIWLVDGELLVAHDRDKVDPEKTLKKLYLDPLQERAKKNGGRIYPNGPEIILLIDIKSAAEPTYTVLREMLEEYIGMLTTFSNTHVIGRAVRVVISGNRPLDTMKAETRHYAAYDGRMSDLDSGLPRTFIPLISASWSSEFKWRGRGEMPPEEAKKLAEIVWRTHEQSRKLRFWAIPGTREFWDVIYEAGVDLINADNLPALQEFLLEKE